jgi:hypothetical protein
MHDYSVSLRISGLTLDPNEVTASLGLNPTQVRLCGRPRPGGKSMWEESMWEYEVWPSNESSWHSLEEGLRTVISLFEPFKVQLAHYQEKFRVLLWCGHFSSSFNGGPTFSPTLLQKLNDFGVEVYLDTYFSPPSSEQ